MQERKVNKVAKQRKEKLQEKNRKGRLDIGICNTGIAKHMI